MASKSTLCCLCSSNIDNHRKRRKLGTETNLHVVPPFIEFYNDCIKSQRGYTLPEEELYQLLPKADDGSRYLCKSPCFSSLEKLVKLREDTKKVEELLKAKRTLSAAYEAVTSGHNTSPAADDTPVAKRPRYIGSTPARRPSNRRQILFGEQPPGSTPGVTVIIIIITIANGHVQG